MANKKQINTKSSKRLSELIKELNMNYADFGESVNLSEYTIRSYTNGVRRLTEDNARIIVKKYPVVRFEWLMGWDDCKTELDFEYQSCVTKELQIYEEFSEEHNFDYILENHSLDMIKESGYKFDYFWNVDDDAFLKQKEFEEYFRFFKRKIDIFEYFFTAEEIENAINKKVDEIYPDRNPVNLSMNHETAEDYKTEDYKRRIVDSFANRVKDIKTSLEFKEKMRMFNRNSVDRNYILLDQNKQIVARCTFAEREDFLKEFNDIVNLFISGFIERQRNRVQKCNLNNNHKKQED